MHPLKQTWFHAMNESSVGSKSTVPLFETWTYMTRQLFISKPKIPKLLPITSSKFKAYGPSLHYFLWSMICSGRDRVQNSLGSKLVGFLPAKTVIQNIPKSGDMCLYVYIYIYICIWSMYSIYVCVCSISIYIVYI